MESKAQVMGDVKGVEAVDRALEILGCFMNEAPSLSLAELAKRTGFYKSTILRLAVSLESHGYLIREETGRYRLGPTTWRLGALYHGSYDLAEIIRPELRRLSEATNETASFYIREGRSRICLFRSEPARAIRHSIVEGTRLTLDRGASGKILLAFSQGDEGEAGIREAGYATSFGERDPEVAALAMPVTTPANQLMGAVSVSGLITRFGDTNRSAFLSALTECRDRLSSRLMHF